MYEDDTGLRNASGCVDHVPHDAIAALNRESWMRICRCVKDMIAVANLYGMRVDALIQLTDRRTGVSNHGEGR